MAIVRLTIEDFLQRSSRALLLDVRSPGEYVHAQVPGAISLPLFTDEERKAVGTAYKQQSREVAIKIGLDYFGPKMRSMVEQVEEKMAARADGSREVCVYCWRGGMRSAGVAWLLDLYGFKVFTLSGGYKAFRNYVLSSFARPYRLKILGGFTGSGKTETLQELQRLGEPVVDLEGLASHKGSAFGALKMPPQPTQEMFENRLAMELVKMKEDDDIWMEDESQRIGNLNIPGALWQTMRQSPIEFLEIPFDERCGHILAGYGDCGTEKLIEAVQRITQRLGGLEAKKTIQYLEQGQLREAFAILLQYYDKQYLKGLNNRENLNSLLHKIPCEKVTPANARVLTKHQPV